MMMATTITMMAITVVGTVEGQALHSTPDACGTVVLTMANSTIRGSANTAFAKTSTVHSAKALAHANRGWVA